MALFVGAVLSGCAMLSREQLGRDVGQIVSSNAGVTPKWRRQDLADQQNIVEERLKAGISADSAVEVALIASPDIQAIFERAGLERANYLEGTSLSDPMIGWSRQGLRGGAGSKVEWNVLQSLSSLLTLPVRRRAAERELDAARMTAAQDILAAITDVRSAWIAAQANEKIAYLAAERNDLARLQTELMERYVRAGNEPVTELQESRLAYAEQQRIAAAAAEAGLQARVNLERLMGVSGLNIAWQLRGEFAALPESDGELADLEATAIKNRLDLRAARRRVEAQLANLSDARIRRILPDLSVGYGRERDPGGEVTAGPQAELQLPIFSSAQASLARSDANTQLAMRDVEASALAVRGEVRLARERVSLARAALLLARDSQVPAAETLAEVRQRELGYMLIGPFEAMEARGAAMAARRELVEAERDYWQARLALARAAALPLQAVREWAELAEKPAP